MKKRVLALLLGVIMVTALFSGCGDDDKKDENTLSYWVGMNSTIATRVNDFNDIQMYKELEKKSGVHIEFIHPAIGQDAEQFNLIVASGELPDLIEYKWATYTGSPQKAIDDGVIIPLNDLIEKHAPNFKKLISENTELSKEYNRACRTDSGQIFAFPTLNTGSYRTFQGPMIRKDWLDELGLEVPVTIDDWTEVLTAFKEKKGVKYPLTGVMGNYIGGRCSFEGAYGIGQRLYVDNGKVKFGPLEDGYKEFLTLLNKWYKAELIDRDFATNTAVEADNKILSDQAGAVFDSIGSGMGVFMQQSEDLGEKMDLVATPYPILKEGDINRFDLGEQDAASAYLAITTACEDPVKAVKWIDRLYSEEGYYLVNFGVEGDTYTMVDGKPVYTEKILNNPEGLGIAEALAMNCRAISPAPGLKQAPEYLEQYYQYPQQVDALKLWAENSANTKTTKMPNGLSATDKENRELASLATDINKYVEEMSLKFITGAEPFKNYDKFVSTLKNNFKVARYIEIEQAMYDRYIKR